MVRVMVPLAQQHEVRQIGTAAVNPVPDVMRLEPRRTRTTRMRAATAVAYEQCPEHAFGDNPMRATQCDDVGSPTAVPLVYDSADPATAQQPRDHRVREAGTAGNPSTRPGAFT